MLGTSFSTAEIFEPYNTPVRMPTSLRYNFRRFLVEYSIKGNLTSVIAETFVFHHRWNHVDFESSGIAFFNHF